MAAIAGGCNIGNAGAMEALLRIIRRSDNRRALSWLGGGLIVLATGIWVLVTHFFPADTWKGETKETTVESQGGIASGRDTNVKGNVSFGSGALPPDSGERPE
jgi:hypothetical protein